MSNRFALLDDSEDEIVAPTVRKAVTTATGLIAAINIGDYTGTWEKPTSRHYRKMVAKSILTEEIMHLKKVYAACMRELVPRVQLRMLHQTLIQEWKETYDGDLYTPASNKREANMYNILRWKFAQCASLCTKPLVLTPLIEEEQVGGYCETCAEYDYCQTGWQIIASLKIADFEKFLTTLQTSVLPGLNGWRFVGMDIDLDSAKISMAPKSLFTIGPDSEIITLNIDLKLNMGYSIFSPEKHKPIYLNNHCSCKEPRGCGRFDCARCVICFEDGIRYGCSEDKTGTRCLRLCALEIIRRFFVRIARTKH